MKKVTAQAAADNVVQKAAVRKCPGGGFEKPPFDQGTQWTGANWNCWIGVPFGVYANPLNGAFYYRDDGTIRPALRGSRIKKPNDALMFTDTTGFYLYSPARPNYYFQVDGDGDGMKDSLTQYQAYSHGRPTVHNKGANTGLLDGHVERVAFKKLWQADASGKPLHSFWYLED